MFTFQHLDYHQDPLPLTMLTVLIMLCISVIPSVTLTCLTKTRFLLKMYIDNITVNVELHDYHDYHYAMLGTSIIKTLMWVSTIRMYMYII